MSKDFKESHESLYRKYTDDTLLQKVENYALWTIPSVFPKVSAQSTNGNAIIEHDYQSVGALMVNRLATKLTSAMFPPNTSFFKIEANAELSKQLAREQIKSLEELEAAACRRLFYNASYAQLVFAMKLLIITGEVLVFRGKKKLRVFSLRNYVLRRNSFGEVQEIIIKECLTFAELPDNIRSVLENKQRPDTDKIELYTRVLFDHGTNTWIETQEVEGHAVNYKGTYGANLCPYFPVAWNLINSDNYGRGYIEEYAGDFAKLSEMSQALTEYELDSLVLLNVYNPAGQFDIDRAVDAKSGDWITGQAESVQSYEIGNYQKIQTITVDIDKIVQRLHVAFMSTSNQRDAERVTQYEIMMNATEAEQVLGGVYSQLSLSMHLPLAYLLLFEVIPSIINSINIGEYELNILTGLQALQRSAQNNALMIAASEINAILPVLSQASKRFNPEKIVESILRANGVNITEIEYTEDEMKQMQADEEAAQAQAMQQQMMMQGAGQEQAVSAVQQSQGII